MYKPYYLKDVIESEKRELFTVMSTFDDGSLINWL